MSETERQPDRRVGVFIDKAPRWQPELRALRDILLDTALTETFKWRQPCYTYTGSNVAILWAFRESCGLGFFKGVLMSDPKGVLSAPGDNSRSARKIAFTDVADVEERKALVRDYIREAIEIENGGLKVELPKDDLALPEEFSTVLADDKALQAAFKALTPGRQRGWILHLSQPKQPATRISRIQKAAPRILEGKGLHDR